MSNGARDYKPECKPTPEQWAVREFAADPNFWLGSKKEGTGLIKVLANFVIERGQAHGQPAHDRGES